MFLQESGTPAATSFARMLTPFPILRVFTVCYRIRLNRFREESTLMSYAVSAAKDNELRMGEKIWLDYFFLAIWRLKVNKFSTNYGSLYLFGPKTFDLLLWSKFLLRLLLRSEIYSYNHYTYKTLVVLLDCLLDCLRPYVWILDTEWLL